MKIISFIIASVFIFSVTLAFANQALFYKEVNIIGGYSDRDEWTGKGDSLMNSIGFEDYRKFSDEYGDFLTTDLQVRFSYDSLEDSQDARAIEIHNAWMEYKLGYGYNIKLGHFDPAFGLEPVLDTHGTLMQTLAKKNIGFKKDWGVALKGSMEKFDYKIALQTGSGMSIRRTDGIYLFTTRIGSPATQDFQYGISFMHGEVLKTKGMSTFPKNHLLSNDAVTKERIGLDAQYLYGPYVFKGELAYGQDDNEDVLGYLFELDYTLPKHQNVQLELQFQSWINSKPVTTPRNPTRCTMRRHSSRNICMRGALASSTGRTFR